MISKLRKYIDYNSKFFEVMGFLSPNMWSLLHLFFVSFAAYFYFIGDFFLGGILFLIGSSLDVIDGGVARNKNINSDFGAIFEASIDRISEGLVFIALSRFFFIAPIALVCSYMVSYVRAKDDRIKIGIAESGERIGILSFFSIFGFVETGLYIVAILAGITVFMRLNEAKRLNT